ncbi:MAG: metallophosphoesterase family protein [Candidatus Omnitrophica bacterium]|nr:metallophosphoesterase family protein [Candidatus Omnitrophota bacterium]
MKIGIVSDTHLSCGDCELPAKLTRELEKCDLIIHAGDLVDICVLDSLSKISKVHAVCGNMDCDNVRTKLEIKEILNVVDKKICVMHGYGHPDKLIDILKNEFFSEKPDIIIFGHSHVPKNEYIDGVLFFNPGSATDTVFAPYRSYGTIEISKDGGIKADIHKL